MGEGLPCGVSSATPQGKGGGGPKEFNPPSPSSPEGVKKLGEGSPDGGIFPKM